MMQIPDLKLLDARPDNQAHILVWDTLEPLFISQLAIYYNAQRVNYRENLLARINPKDNFLTLHHYLERELEAIKSLCFGVNKSMVLLEGLDCLITYLYVQCNSHLKLFWKNLEETRKLERILWILLPSKLVPVTWPAHRVKYIV